MRSLLTSSSLELTARACGFQTVFIAGVVDGLIPIFNASDMEEENRLFSVAVGFRTCLLFHGRLVARSIRWYVSHRMAGAGALDIAVLSCHGTQLRGIWTQS